MELFAVVDNMLLHFLKVPQKTLHIEDGFKKRIAGLKTTGKNHRLPCCDRVRSVL